MIHKRDGANFDGAYRGYDDNGGGHVGLLSCENEQVCPNSFGNRAASLRKSPPPVRNSPRGGLITTATVPGSRRRDFTTQRRVLAHRASLIRILSAVFHNALDKQTDPQTHRQTDRLTDG